MFDWLLVAIVLGISGFFSCFFLGRVARKKEEKELKELEKRLFTN